MEKKDYKQEIIKITKNAKEITLDASHKVKNTLDNTQASIINAMDENGDGKVDIEDIIILGLKSPGIKLIDLNF